MTTRTPDQPNPMERGESGGPHGGATSGTRLPPLPRILAALPRIEHMYGVGGLDGAERSTGPLCYGNVTESLDRLGTL